MAFNVVHYAFFPSFIGFVHEVACNAELWIVLRIIIDEVR